MSDCVNPCLCGWLNDPQKPVGVRQLSLPDIKNASSIPCWIELTSVYNEVPHVDYEKLSGDRLGKTSESIRAIGQAARKSQLCVSSGGVAI